jgi:hypothetical protein
MTTNNFESPFDKKDDHSSEESHTMQIDKE